MTTGLLGLGKLMSSNASGVSDWLNVGYHWSDGAEALGSDDDGVLESRNCRTGPAP